MAAWRKNPTAWLDPTSSADQQDPRTVMRELDDWCNLWKRKEGARRIVGVSWAQGFWTHLPCTLVPMWVVTYAQRYGHKEAEYEPFFFRFYDLRSFLAGSLNLPVCDITRGSRVVERWVVQTKKQTPCDEAFAQGALFINALFHRRRQSLPFALAAEQKQQTPLVAKAKELWVSVDIECDGQDVGRHSLLAIGAVVFCPETGAELGREQWNIHPDRGRTTCADTMKWWSGFPDAWEQVTQDTMSAREAMQEFSRWCESWRRMQGADSVVALAWPAGFDLTWLQAYALHQLNSLAPFYGHFYDIKSFLAGAFGCALGGMSKYKEPVKSIISGSVTHMPCDDAHQQGCIFVNGRTRAHYPKQPLPHAPNLSRSQTSCKPATKPPGTPAV